MGWAASAWYTPIGIGFVDGWRLVVEEMGGGAAVCRFSEGIGTGGYEIQIEVLYGTDMGIGHLAVVEGILSVRNPGKVRSEHHGDGPRRGSMIQQFKQR
jgi:hypothetical protein